MAESGSTAPAAVAMKTAAPTASSIPTDRYSDSHAIRRVLLLMACHRSLRPAGWSRHRRLTRPGQRDGRLRNSRRCHLPGRRCRSHSSLHSARLRSRQSRRAARSLIRQPPGESRSASLPACRRLCWRADRRALSSPHWRREPAIRGSSPQTSAAPSRPSANCPTSGPPKGGLPESGRTFAWRAGVGVCVPLGWSVAQWFRSRVV